MLSSTEDMAQGGLWAGLEAHGDAGAQVLSLRSTELAEETCPLVYQL